MSIVFRGTQATGDVLTNAPVVRRLARLWLLVAALAVVMAAPAAGERNVANHRVHTAATTVHIGIPVTTLINGQVGLVLRRTNILKLNGVSGDVIEFTHGPPQNEALAAGRIQVALTSEGPAVLGISQGIDGVVFASFGYTRDALLVRGNSPIREPGDLRGKSIGVPYGTTPFLHLNRFLDRNGLKSSVHLVNIGPEELAAALVAGSVDAVEYNEPLPTNLVQTAGARVVARDHLAYAAVMRGDLLRAHRSIAIKILVSIADATLYMATHRKQVDKWFSDVSRTDLSVVRLASQHTRIYQHTRKLSDVKLGLNRAFVSRLQSDADFFAANGFSSHSANMTRATDLHLWSQAQKILRRQHEFMRRVRVVR